MDPYLPEPCPATPELFGPVHAFRDWRVTPEGLSSPRTDAVWTSRVLAAECRPRTVEDLVHPPHRAPGRDCSCGVHAYFRPGYETSKIDYTGVTGIVTVWGHVEVHANGVRAEFACVEALGVYSRWTRRQKSAVFEIADELDVDLHDLYELEEAATGYGAAVPAPFVPSRSSEGRWRRKPEPPPSSVVIFGH